MCGINGIIRQQELGEDTLMSVMERMNHLITHRGPDDDGFFMHKSKAYDIGMAMRRLSIIDLDTGKQPIYNQDKSIVIVFNGEIYNYKHIKQELEQQNVVFSTQSDTEVILKLYEKKGVKGFDELDGMFAFSIYDKKKSKVFIARDFFGEKPLYYCKNGFEMFWASELKSIRNALTFKPELSKIGLNLFFKLTYIPAPFTIYENIFKLEANHYIEYDLIEHALTIHEIKSTDIIVKQDISFNKAALKLNDLVLESIESRSIADVPLGTFLSGGVDSSIISFGLSKLTDKKIDTFSIGFKKASFNETDKSQLVAKLINSNHHEFILSENDIKNQLNDILLNFDEPFADSSALPTYFVSNKTRVHVKAALTGDGGDEVFGGYNKYYIGKLNSTYTNIVPKVLHNNFQNIFNKVLSTKDDNRGKRFKIKKFLNAVNYNGNYYWNIISLGFSSDLSNLLHPKYTTNNIFAHYKDLTKLDKPKTLNAFREIDRHISLEGDMLVKVDRTSMQNSLECRAPFLNKTLWDFSNSLPEKYLIKGWNKKRILKEAFKKEFPKGFLDKSKKGFVVPVGDWLRSGLKQELETYIDTKFLEMQGIFNAQYVKTIVQNHLNEKQDNSYRVWTFYTFQKWYCNIYNN